MVRIARFAWDDDLISHRHASNSRSNRWDCNDPDVIPLSREDEGDQAGDRRRRPNPKRGGDSRNRPDRAA